MKIPIPDDWGGQSWRCVSIEWPDSPQYMAILMGFLSQLTRGRYWDEQSGTITDAQAVGWRIWDRNVPLRDCDGDIIGDNGAGAGGDQAGTGGGIVILEDDDMGQVVTEIKVVDGRLRVYYGHCCYEELDIPALLNTSEEGTIGADPLNPNADPDFVYSACGKAAAVVNAVYLIIESAFSAVNEPYPWQFVPYVERQVGYDLDNNWLLTLLANVAVSVGAGQETFGDVNDLVERQHILSSLAGWFSDDAEGVPTQADFESIKGLFKSEIYPDPRWQYFDQAINALGKTDMNTIAKLGAGDTSQDCGAVLDWPSIPGITDWVHYYDFRPSLHGWTHTGGLWVSGQGLYNPDVDWAESLGSVAKTPTNGGYVTFMALEVKQWPAPIGLGQGGGPWWFKVDADAFYDDAYLNSESWIMWIPAAPILIDGEISVAKYQWGEQTVEGISQWYRLVIAGTGTDPFAGDP